MSEKPTDDDSDENQPELPGDAEWIDLVRDKLKVHGAKKELAQRLMVHPSTVTRMAQGKPVRTGVLWKASVELGIRPPTTLPQDPLQQRLTRALTKLRQFVAPYQAEAVVARLEGIADGAAAAWQKHMQTFAANMSPDGSMPGRVLQGGLRALEDDLAKLTETEVNTKEFSRLFGRLLIGTHMAMHHPEEEEEESPE